MSAEILGAKSISARILGAKSAIAKILGAKVLGAEIHNAQILSSRCLPTLVCLTHKGVVFWDKIMTVGRTHL